MTRMIEAIEPRIHFSVTFAAPKTLPRSVKENNLTAIATGDFGNGHPDIAALDQGKNGAPGSIQVFLDNGLGQFKLSQSLATGAGSQFMQAVDLYGNGKLDLIVSNATDGTLDIFVGDGDSTFSTLPVVVTFGPKESFNGTSIFNDPFRVGELLGPGAANGIVVADQYDLDTVVLQLDANQQLNVTQTIPIQLTNFVLADTDGTGFPNIVEESANTIQVFGNQAGTFASTATSGYSLGLSADYNADNPSITTGDFAGNGLTDLAVPTQPDSTLLGTNPGAPGMLSVLMAQPGGGFAPAVLSDEPADDKGPVAADVNLDGVLDLITQSAGSSDVLVGNGDGTFTDQHLSIPAAGLDQFATADFNGDGSVDFVTVDSKYNLALFANRTLSPSAGSTALSPIVTKTTLPQQIVIGSNTHGTATVDVTNTDPVLENGTVTTSVYASADGLFDSSSILIGSITRKLMIKPGATLAVPVQIKTLPTSLNGTYSLLAQTTNANGSVATESGPSIAVSAPFIAFTESIVKTTLPSVAVSDEKTRAAVQLRITNNGNIVSTGKSTISIYTSGDGVAADGTLIRTLPASIAFKPGASRLITVPLRTLPAVANGNFFLVAQLTDPLANVTSVSTSATYSLSAPFVSLAPAITLITQPAIIASGSPSNSAISLTITNNGNITSTGTSTVAIYASVDGSAADGTLLKSQPLHNPIAAGKTVKLRIAIDQFSGLTAGSYFLTTVVTDSTGMSQTATSLMTYAVTG